MATFPYARHSNGRDYVCGREPTVVIPDGCIVQGHWTSGTLDGVKAIRVGDRGAITVVHSCGTLTGLTTKWSGQHS